MSQLAPTNAKAILRVDESYSRYVTRPIAGGELDDLKHAKVGNTNDPISGAILPPQPNYGTEISFQQPLSAHFELRLRF